LGNKTHVFIIKKITIMSLRDKEKCTAVCISELGCNFKKSIYGVKTNMQMGRQNVSIE